MAGRNSEVEGPDPPPRDDRAEYEKLKSSAQLILGSDECGLGSWAGPCVTCAVAVPKDWKPPFGLNDSKKVGSKKREQLFEILRNRVPYACEMAQSDEIDRVGITLALRRCFRTCIDNVLARAPGALIVIDGEVRIPGIDHLRFPKADGIVPAVMAASVIGKVLHDRYMWLMAEKYPGYSFHKSSGYGTKEHREAIDKLGLCPIHRRSYIPIKKAERLQGDKGICLDPDPE